MDPRGEREANPAFPLCLYTNKHKEGTVLGEYKGDTYCDAFQTTFNDHGLCYTYNNVKLFKDDEEDNQPFKIRNVEGCGKERGFQMVIDNHAVTRMMDVSGRRGNREATASGFKVRVIHGIEWICFAKLYTLKIHVVITQIPCCQ